MNKYELVEERRQNEEIRENEVRIQQQGKPRNYISYAVGLLTEKGASTVTIKAMGRAISKTITVAEIIKRRVPDLHQITELSSVEIVDVYRPLEEGLDTLENVRSVSCIIITLSKNPLDTHHPGYQAPLPSSDVTPEAQNTNARSAGGRGRGRGGRGRGRRGRGGKRRPTREGANGDDQSANAATAPAPKTSAAAEETKEQQPVRGKSRRRRYRGPRQPREGEVAAPTAAAPAPTASASAAAAAPREGEEAAPPRSRRGRGRRGRGGRGRGRGRGRGGAGRGQEGDQSTASAGPAEATA